MRARRRRSATEMETNETIEAAYLVGGGGGAEEERRREVAPADRRSGPREIQQPQERIISAGEQEPPRTGPGPATGRRHAAGVHAHTLYILCLGLVYLAS